MATKKRKTLPAEQEEGQRKELLAARFLEAHREATKEGDSDRESCASHRSQDSLDILDGECFQLTR